LIVTFLTKLAVCFSAWPGQQAGFANPSRQVGMTLCHAKPVGLAAAVISKTEGRLI
jgi:hypothetical protein